MVRRCSALVFAFLGCISTLGCTDVISEILKRKRGDAGADGDAARGPTASATAPTPPTVDSGRGLAPNGKPLAGRTPSTEPSGVASKAELEKAFASFDINSDDQLDGIEVKNCGCATADSNGDGEVAKSEYLAAGFAGKLRAGSLVNPTPKRDPAPTPTTPTPTPTTPAPTPTTPAPTPTTPAPTPTTPGPSPAPAPVVNGVPPGTYKCAGSVGGTYMTTGRLVIVDGQRYAHGTDGAGGTYVFYPETKLLRFTSGLYADPEKVSYARQVSPTHIQMKTGRNGSYLWDCKR